MHPTEQPACRRTKHFLALMASTSEDACSYVLGQGVAESNPRRPDAAQSTSPDNEPALSAFR